MKRVLATILGCAVLAACQSEPVGPPSTLPPAQSSAASPLSSSSSDSTPPPATIDNTVVAMVRGEPITVKDLQPILMQAYGLNVLLVVVRKELAMDELAKQHLIVTPADIDAERKITMKELERAATGMQFDTPNATQPDVDLSPEQTNQMLDQVLAQQHISRAEFEIVLETNAALRKIAGPEVDKKITEDAVHQQFNVLYGEKVRVRYIVCQNMADAANVRRDLGAGKTFEEVARARSLDRVSGENGGELEPFTMQDNRFPDEFKELAFVMKKGEISEPIQIGNFVYIMKLVDRIPPQLAKYEVYHDAVRQDLYDKTVQAAMSAMNRRLGQIAVQSMHIEDPVLAHQWQERVAAADGSLHDPQQIRSAMDQEHASATRQATSQPGDSSGDSSTNELPTNDSPNSSATTQPATVAPAAADATVPATAP